MLDETDIILTGMRFFLLGYHFQQCCVVFVSFSWKLEGSLLLSNTLDNTPCIFHWKRVAFLFLLSVFIPINAKKIINNFDLEAN